MASTEDFLHSFQENGHNLRNSQQRWRDDYMLEGWEIAEATRQKAAEFGRKCDWCERRVITHIVVGNKQRSSMVCDHCYRKKNVKEIEEATTLKKKPHRWANGSKKKKRVIFEST